VDQVATDDSDGAVRKPDRNLRQVVGGGESRYLLILRQPNPLLNHHPSPNLPETASSHY
jgi:hypothetical protein